MNHDYTHCMDWTKDCPKECFRARITSDLVNYPFEVSYAHLKDTKECLKREEKK